MPQLSGQDSVVKELRDSLSTQAGILDPLCPVSERNGERGVGFFLVRLKFVREPILLYRHRYCRWSSSQPPPPLTSMMGPTIDENDDDNNSDTQQQRDYDDHKEEGDKEEEQGQAFHYHRRRKEQQQQQQQPQDSDSSLSVGDLQGMSMDNNINNKDQNEEGTSLPTSSPTSTTTTTTSRIRHRVAFSTVHIHRHMMILGDNPGALNRGPPLSISWTAFDTITLSVDEYERMMTSTFPPRRRLPNQLVLPCKQRQSILMELGYSRVEIQKAALIAEHDRTLRRRTNQQRRWDHTHALVEDMSRTLHHCLTLGRGIKRQEHERLRPFLLSSTATPSTPVTAAQSPSSSSSSSRTPPHKKTKKTKKLGVSGNRQRKKKNQQPPQQQQQQQEGNMSLSPDPWNSNSMTNQPTNEVFVETSERSSSSMETTTTTPLDMSESSSLGRFISSDNVRNNDDDLVEGWKVDAISS